MPFFVLYISILEWVKHLQFPKINEAEIADDSSQSAAVECDQQSAIHSHARLRVIYSL